MSKVDGTVIGVDKRKWYDRKNDVVAKRLESGLTFEQAEALAKNRSGAELLVATTGGRNYYSGGGYNPYKYDVFSVTIHKGDKEGKKISDNQVKFDSSPGSTATGVSPTSETFLYDENHGIRVFARNGDYDKARAVVEHVKSDDFGGAKALTLTVQNGTMQASLKQSIDRVVTAKADKEHAETRLKGELASAEQALAGKRAPFDQAVAAAETAYGNVSNPLLSITYSKQYALTEAQKPGYHEAQRQVNDRASDVRSAQNTLERAESSLKTAEGKVSKANDLEADRKKNKRELEGKLDEFPRVRERLRDIDITLNEYQKAQEYKQQYGEYPAGHDPISGMPNNAGDSYYGLTNTKRDLEQKLSQEPTLKRQIRELEDPSSEERRLREEGTRDIRSAGTDIRRAEQALGAARADLRTAEDKFRNLPAGDPAKIQAAQKELDDANDAWKKAVVEPGRKVAEAKTARDAAIQGELAAVEGARQRLANAPMAYQKALDDLANAYK